MASKLVIHGPATFRQAVTIETDKKINLFYGLNGSGKTTVCRVMREPANLEYAQCSLNYGVDNPQVYVFNEQFIEDNFYVSDAIKGVFSLSKQNKDAEEAIRKAQAAKDIQEREKQDLEVAIGKLNSSLKASRTQAEENAFAIKRNYSGGDRVLEFCLEGLKAQKEKLFDHLLAITPLAAAPTYSVDDLRKELMELDVSGDTPVSELSLVNLSVDRIEASAIFPMSIIGSNNSVVSQLIARLNHADWVRQGIGYLEVSTEASRCPFCQEPTITPELIKQFKDYFDKAYEQKLAEIKELALSYEQAMQSLPKFSDHTANPFFDTSIRTAYQALEKGLQENIRKIEAKRANPSTVISLASSKELLTQLNNAIEEANKKIRSHNAAIRDKDATRAGIKDRFWKLMRHQYDQTLQMYGAEKNKVSEELLSLKNKVVACDTELARLNTEIRTALAVTVNTDGAVKSINAALIELGITDFSIKSYGTNSYHLARADGEKERFDTFSEGEKMIIAFLYFIETCLGRSSPDEVIQKRIVVLDDPISSLSHIHVFNVGRLIGQYFYENNSVTQLFIFTHSLYFFYELAYVKKQARDKDQKLFRVYKNADGTHITPMKYEEIQNDYHTYWQIVNDPDQPPAIIANCMRNIVEYFFGFVERQSFGNLFQEPALKTPRLSAFNRYMNRESHSFGQNIFDFKEFDYAIFKEGLQILFEKKGYAEHYRTMTA